MGEGQQGEKLPSLEIKLGLELGESRWQAQAWQRGQDEPCPQCPPALPDQTSIRDHR